MNFKAAEIENQGKGESHSVGNNNLPRIMLGNENAESSGSAICSSREEKDIFRVMFTIKPLGFVLTPFQNGMGAKVGQHSNKHLKQDIPRGTELFAIGDTKLVDMKHEEIMRLLDEAKLPVNLTFKKVKKRVRILTPRSANLLQLGKSPSSFSSVDLGLKKLPSEEFKERAKENAASKQKAEAQKPKQGKTRQQKRREYMQRQRARQAARLRQRQERNQQRFQSQNNAHYQNRNQQRFDRRAPNHWQQSRDPRFHRDQRYEHVEEPRHYRNPRQQNYNREPRIEDMRRMDFAHRRSYPQNGYQHDYPPQRGYSRDYPPQRGYSRDYPQQRDHSRAHPQRRGYDRPQNWGQRPMDHPKRGYEPRSDYLFSDENIVGRLGREQFEYQRDRYMNRDQHRQHHKEYHWKSADELYKPRRDPARVMNLADFAPRKNNGSWSEVSSPLMLDSSEKSSADGHDSCSESGASTSKQSVASQELTIKDLNATLSKVEHDKSSFLRSRGLDFNDDWES